MVSDHGRVMVTPYTAKTPAGGKYARGGVPTVGYYNGRARRHLITVGGRGYSIGRLVTEAFHGSAPFASAVSMHLDEIATNNAAGNLRWASPAENMNSPKYIAYVRSRTRNKRGRWI